MFETYNLSKKFGVSFKSDPVEFWLEKIKNMPFNMTSSMHVDFKIWTLSEEETIIASDDYDKGGHIIRYDTNSLANGIYTFGIETESQKTVKKFEIDN